MPKKTFDIIPPREKEANIDSAPVYFETKKKQKTARKNKLLFISIFLGIVLIFSLAYFFIEPKAEIDIWPKMTEVNFETQATIAGTELVAEETSSREFSSTGSSEEKQKAGGVITVYNNYHLEQILVQNTRFWCFDNDNLREFKTKARVTIPPGGHLDVEVVASEPGAEYNIPPCTFSVPGLKGSPRYTAVYGESSSPMTGGGISGIAKVTDNDLSSAKSITTQEAFQKSQDSLQKLLSSGDYISVEGGTVQKIIKEGSTAKAGDFLEKFPYEAKAQTKSLVLKKSDLESFAKEYVLSQISQGKEIQESSLKLDYSSLKADLESGKISLDLKITANIYSGIDEASLKEQMKSKKLEQIQQDFGSYSEIDKVKVRLWPFWVTRTPEDTDRVDIKLII